MEEISDSTTILNHIKSAVRRMLLDGREPKPTVFFLRNGDIIHIGELHFTENLKQFVFKVFLPHLIEQLRPEEIILVLPSVMRLATDPEKAKDVVLIHHITPVSHDVCLIYEDNCAEERLDASKMEMPLLEQVINTLNRIWANYV